MSSHISLLSTQIYSPQSTQSTTEFFPFVIQSEAKDLDYTHFMYTRFFTTLRSALNDRNGIPLWMTM